MLSDADTPNVVLPALQALASAPPEVLVSGVTGTYRVAAFGVLLSTALAAAALWMDRKRRTQTASGPKEA